MQKSLFPTGYKSLIRAFESPDEDKIVKAGQTIKTNVGASVTIYFSDGSESMPPPTKSCFAAAR